MTRGSPSKKRTRIASKKRFQTIETQGAGTEKPACRAASLAVYHAIEETGCRLVKGEIGRRSSDDLCPSCASDPEQNSSPRRLTTKRPSHAASPKGSKPTDHSRVFFHVAATFASGYPHACQISLPCREESRTVMTRLGALTPDSVRVEEGPRNRSSGPRGKRPAT